MKSFLKLLLGFNAIALIHLVRFQPKRFLMACKSAYVSSRTATTRVAFPIPEISLGDILADNKPIIRMCVMRYEHGTLPYDQAVTLLSILVAEAPSEVLEIGTFMGQTTRQIAENLPAGTVHTVDL